MSVVYETEFKFHEAARELQINLHPAISHALKTIGHKSFNQESDTLSLYFGANIVPSGVDKLKETDANLIYKALKTNKFVACLNLQFQNIGDSGAKFVAQLLEETTSLSDLDLTCNDITEEGAKFLAKALLKNKCLRKLNLTGNKIGSKGGLYLAQVLQVNTTLKCLDLNSTDQKTDSLIALATVLNHNSSVASLNVSRPLLFSQQEETTVHFARMLKVNHKLCTLHLAKHDMKDFGAIRIAEHLWNNLTLTYLDLSCNRITRDGIKEIAKFLQQDTPLRVLDLGFNRASDDGAIYLADALAGYNTNLRVLVLASNEVKGRGLCALANSLKFNTSLVAVYVWGNELEESACIAFSQLIDSGRLQLANTDVKPYSVDGRMYLGQLDHGLKQQQQFIYQT